MKKTLTGAALAALLAGPALAELVIPDLSYRTGPYAANGTPVSDGFQDYLRMLNARDGGIGGEPIRIVECETGYNTEKGVECYENTKGEGALVYNPLSTGITYQLIPKVTADNIPMLTLGYGRTSAANGAVFRNVFNFPANYWDGASIAVKYLLDENGGSLDGKKIALIYHNSAFGKEPIRTLQELSEKHGFELTEIPVDPPGQEQKSQWLQIRREKPDYVIMWGWGVQNQVAIQEAANIRFPMENFIGVWWAGSEQDVRPAGAGADGYKALAMTNIDPDRPVYDDIRQYVVDAGEAAGDGSNLGTVLYDRGMYTAMLVAESIKKAQELAGTSAITPAQLRDGMEALEITSALMEELGMPDIGPEFAVSCADHGGSGKGLVQQWDADSGTWTTLTDYIEPDHDVIDPLVEEDSAAFAQENGITPGCAS